MAVVKIKVLNLIGRMSELEKTVNILGKSGIFHPDNVLSFYSDTEGFSPISEENPYSDTMRRMTETLRSIEKRVPLLGVKEIEKIESSVRHCKTYASTTAEAFGKLLEDRGVCRQKIAGHRREMEKVRHFVGLDINLAELRDCRFIKFRFGFLPTESYEKIEALENPYVAFFPSTSDSSGYWGMYCAPIDKIEEIDKIFSGLYFERTRFAELIGTPEQNLADLDKKCEAERANIKATNDKIEALWQKEEPKFRDVYSWLSEKYICYNIRRFAARYGDNFILAGWVPADQEKSMREQLDRLRTVKFTLDDGSDPDVLIHSPPVQLKNKKLFRPFEFLVGIYGMPAYDELDPTSLVAFSYVLLYGIMFADLGQGLCISLAGVYMARKKMGLGKVLIPCGIFSAIFGILFGSVFGFEDALNPFYKAVFGLPTKPISVLEPQFTSVIIYSAVGVGILSVIIAIILGIVSSLRRKHYENGLFGPNGIAGLVFYCAIVFGLAGQLVLGWHVLTPLYVCFLLVLPILAMFLKEILGSIVAGDNEWKSINFGEYAMQSFFEVFEYLLSFLTNTVSFIRVGAFVLVHAGMMTVVFMLAGSPHSIGYIPVLIIGNIFVIALEGLISGIQALRLDFFEMFSRFFDGDGRPFAPVVIGQES